MSELETRLRAVLAEATPTDLDVPGLAGAALAEAARARRVRRASVAAVLAVLVAVGGALGAGAFRDRAAVPAKPVDHLSCALAGRVLAPEPMSGGRPLSTTAREALVCADTGGNPPSPLNFPEYEPVVDRVDLDYLRFDPPSAATSCPRLPAGHTYRMLVLGTDGRARALDNTALACNGWPALDRYAVALGDQESTALAAKEQTDPFPKCPSILGQQVAPRSGRPAALPRGTRFTAATSCLHPISSLDTIPTDPVTVSRRVLSAQELAVLNAALDRAGSVKKAGDTCPGPRNGNEAVVRAVTTTGRAVVLTHLCPDSYQLAVDWNADDLVTFTQKVFDALGGS